MNIDHEAAKELARQTTEDINASGALRFMSRALIDLHAQLAAERERVDALVKLVARAYNDGFSAGLYDYRKHSGGTVWYDSKAKVELARIMEGRA